MIIFKDLIYIYIYIKIVIRHIHLNIKEKFHSSIGYCTLVFFFLIIDNPNRIKTRSKNRSLTRRKIPAFIKKKFTITAEIV